MTHWSTAHRVKGIIAITYNCHGYVTYCRRLPQGSVTEDKSSGSHLVVPIPTSLEEGEASPNRSTGTPHYPPSIQTIDY